jgi:hypothetical protein
MRKSLSICLIFLLTAVGVPSPVFAAAQATGTVTGVVRGGQLQPLGSVRVHLRNLQTGDAIAETTTTAEGSFTFDGVAPGTYVVEAIDGSGNILGVGAPAALTAGGTATTSVIAPSVGGAAASAGGFHLLGMGPVTSATVLGAAAAASVIAVVATRPNASPSR